MIKVDEDFVVVITRLKGPGLQVVIAFPAKPHLQSQQHVWKDHGEGTAKVSKTCSLYSLKFENYIHYLGPIGHQNSSFPCHKAL